MKEEPKGPYVFQPYGAQDKAHWDAGRIYGVGGIHPLITIKGLTKEEAFRVIETLCPETVNVHDRTHHPR